MAWLSLGKLTQAAPDFKFNYMLASSMYGYTNLAEILPEVHKIGATAIDLWPKVHGNQREQLDEMGEEAFRKLLDAHEVQLRCLTNYKRGPFELKGEVELAQRFGCKLIVTEGRGPVGLKGIELRSAVSKFIEQLKPHLDFAQQHGVDIAIENHGNNLIESADSLKYLIDLRPTENLKIALAPYHLSQDPIFLANLIRDLGNNIAMFYAWQHGNGCMEAMPKEKELLQMPGRGELDFRLLVEAFRTIQYTGWTEIFMHPFPRGVPILETTSQVTIEINRARSYLDGLVKS
jgi:sugar phosphate isomerase/epimerase